MPSSFHDVDTLSSQTVLRLEKGIKWEKSFFGWISNWEQMAALLLRLLVLVQQKVTLAQPQFYHYD